jgi:UDP-GlcNAc:undecaprenyl-phosphate GlcNAc-1-phosphate transferase
MDINAYPPFVFSNVLIGLALALAAGPAATVIARRIGLMDVPGALPHKRHSRPVPLAGGLVLVIVLLLGSLLNLPMLSELWRILVPALVIFGVGMWDDFKRLPPWAKLAGQFVAAALLILLGTYVQIAPPGFLGLPGRGHVAVNLLITLLWVVGITNAFNFIDSMDGIVVGIAGIAVAFLILVTFNSPQMDLLRLLTLLLGACVGLYYFNKSPARLFLGDSGAQTLGFLLAAVGILYTPTAFPQGSSWFLPILILGVPIFDTCLVVFSRLKHHTPIYQAGINHTYHRLVAIGFDGPRAVAVMHMASIVLGCLAFIALNLAPLFSNTIFVFTLLVGLAAFAHLERKAG